MLDFLEGAREASRCSGLMRALIIESCSNPKVMQPNERWCQRSCSQIGFEVEAGGNEVSFESSFG
jgi:hypothetical protein